MSIYKITRPETSQRRFAYGYELKPNESLYVDNLKVAAAFNSLTWTAKEVDRVENGSSVIECMKDEILKTLIDNKDIHFAIKPKGKWLVEKPPQWSRVFVFGWDTRKPFEVEDYDVVEKFQKLKFKVTGIKDEAITMDYTPGFGNARDEGVEQEKAEIIESMRGIEGSDSAHQLKGAPMTTYSLPKRKPGRPPKIRPEVKIGT